MSKRLIFVFCALLAFAFAVPAFAAVQNIKVSGDILSRGIYRNDFDLTKDAAGSDDNISVFDTVTRLRVDADLTDNVSTTVRVINERNWTENDDASSDILLDLASVTMREFMCSPLTLTIGRQELHFGNDMIIGDGVGNPFTYVTGTNQTTNYFESKGGDASWYDDRYYPLNSVNGDLSLRKSFDAIRGTLNYDPLVIDVVYAMIRENNIVGWETNDDAYLWGINSAYRFGDKWSTLAEAYFWSKIDDASPYYTFIGDGDAIKQKTDTVYTYGFRVNTNPTSKINMQQEFAFQFGKENFYTDGRDRRAWASQTMGYITPGWKYDPMFGLVYSFFSGEADPGLRDPDKRYHGWDPMFENQTAGHIINALFPQTNAHNIDFMMKLVPFEDVTLRADYVMQFLAKKFPRNGGDWRLNDHANQLGSGELEFAGDERFIGQELDLNLTFDYTEDVQFGLLTGWFWPGHAVAETNSGTYKQRVMASEVIASCNVKF